MNAIHDEQNAQGGKPGRSGPPGNRNAVKHGLYVYKAMLNGDGLDKRTSLYRALAEKERDLITALGGDPSPQQQAVISDSVKNALYRFPGPLPDGIEEPCA
jgi:hypothetical protein